MYLNSDQTLKEACAYAAFSQLQRAAVSLTSSTVSSEELFKCPFRMSFWCGLSSILHPLCQASSSATCQWRVAKAGTSKVRVHASLRFTARCSDHSHPDIQWLGICSVGSNSCWGSQDPGSWQSGCSCGLSQKACLANTVLSFSDIWLYVNLVKKMTVRL